MSNYQAHRKGDQNQSGAEISRVNQFTVYTENELQSINDSQVAPHGTGAHANPLTDNGSTDVFTVDTESNFKGNEDTCGHQRDTGATTVFINAGGNTITGLPVIDVSEILNIPEVQPGVTEFTAAIHLKDEPIEDDGLAVFPTGTAQQSLENGLPPDLPEPESIEEDNIEPEPVEEISGDCDSDIFSKPTNFKFPPTFRLSASFTLSQLTTNTAISRYALRAQGGLTTNQIVCNLRLLCINILEPLKESYPTMFITSGFRHGSGKSQHNKGQAADIQFGGFSFQEYWDTVQQVKKDLPYDQLILEYGNRPWFHMSYKEGGRHQVLTRTKPGVYKPGLIRIK